MTFEQQIAPSEHLHGKTKPHERHEIPLPTIEVGGASEKSLYHLKKYKEDADYFSSKAFSAGVFDGVGGCVAGDIASATARDILENVCKSSDPSNPFLSHIFGSTPATKLHRSEVETAMKLLFDEMNHGLRRAIEPNTETYRRASAQIETPPGVPFNPDNPYHANQLKQLLSNLSTTASVLKFWRDPDQKDFVTIGHVGDSRIYRWRKGKLERLTHEDSYTQPLLDLGIIQDDHAMTQIVTRQQIEQALNSGLPPRSLAYLRNLLSFFDQENVDDLPLDKFSHFVLQTLGATDAQVSADLRFEPYIQTEEVQDGDVYFALTDGIEKNLSEKELLELYELYHDESSEIISRVIVEAALEHSRENPENQDDITLVILKFGYGPLPSHDSVV